MTTRRLFHLPFVVLLLAGALATRTVAEPGSMILISQADKGQESEGPGNKAEGAKARRKTAVEHRYVARTAEASRKQGKVKLRSRVWHCSGDRCRIAGPWPAPVVSECQALAARVGRIVSYGRTGAQLGKSQLEQCNRGLATASRPEPRHAGPDASRRAEPRRTPLKKSAKSPGRLTATRAAPAPPEAPPVPHQPRSLESGAVLVRTRTLTATGQGDPTRLMRGGPVLPAAEYDTVRVRTRTLTVTGQGDPTGVVDGGPAPIPAGSPQGDER